MAPSLVKTVGAAAVALAAHAGATKSYKVSEVYNSTNFFDKFNFVTAADPNGGYVQYQSRSKAESLGLVKTQNQEVYLGVDYSSGDYTAEGAGRKSVRLESKTVYNHGLVIADFTHLPKPVCGSWPAFWFFGEPWPTKGEIDVYENWNDLTFNRHTAHVDAPSVVGECTLSAGDMTATIDSSNCYDFASGQANYQGCSASEYSSTFGSASGGIFALEWTDDYLKIWDWPRLAAPLDVLSGKPSPSLLWGTPSYMIKKCNIDKAFKDMKMVLDIDFCGVAGQTDKWGASCKAKTGYATCPEYVAAKHGDFAQVNFKIKDIKFYNQVEDTQTSTSSTSSTTSSTTLSTTSATITSSSSVSVTTTSSALYGNSSSTASGDDDSNSYAVSPTGYTTSTIYTTSVHTVTSCAATVTNCPAGGYVTTEIISVGTTVCPVTETGSSPQPTTTAGTPAGYTTSTIEVTKTYTITSCKPTVTNCPVGSVTTEVSVATTVYPVDTANPGTETDVVVTATVVPVTSVGLGYNATLTTSVTYPAGAATGTAGVVGGCTGSGCGVVVVSGGVKTGASLTLAGVAAFFFLAM